MAFVSTPQPRHSPLLLQILAAILGGLVLFIAGLAALNSGYRLLFSDRIYPGIWMAGVDLSSLTPQQATVSLNQRITYPANGQIVFRDGDRIWVAKPVELGMVFDVGSSVEHAYELGRQGGLMANLADQMNAWQGGLYIPPVIIFDGRVAHRYLQNLAAQMDQPVVEADLQLVGTEVIYTPGQIGRLLNVDKTMEAVQTQLKSFQDGEIRLVIEEQAPLILDAGSQADTLRRVIGAPLILNIAGGPARGSGSLDDQSD